MKKIYLQVSTHWDREWYVPFQSFRYGLVQTTDKILEELEDGEVLDTFVFDGQSIVAEDYLEIVPENRERFCKLVKEGKLILGPWYIMPDEFLVSGESLIRNLLMGERVTKSYGPVTYLYGYINDIFGHVAQLPQIFGQFGIRMAYLGRGLRWKNYDNRHFVWSAPDGSECLGYYQSYGAFYRGYRNFVTGSAPTESEKDAWVEEYLNRELDQSGDVLLLNITDDHAYVDEIMLDLIRRVRKWKGAELVEKTFPHAYEDILAQKAKLRKVVGTLNQTSDGSTMRLVTDSISSFYPLKQENDRCQLLLEGVLAPILAYSILEGKPLRKEFLTAAYRELLKNQPHDSICGCSADQVHKDMIYRYDQVRAITEAVRRDFCLRMEGKPEECEEGMELTIFNPAPFVREQIITVDVEFPVEYASRFAGEAPFQPRNMFCIRDVAGNILPCQVMQMERRKQHFHGVYSQQRFDADFYKISFPARLSGFGKTQFRIMPVTGIHRKNENVLTAYKTGTQSVTSGDHWMENAYVRLAINADGTLKLQDKENGREYDNLHYFLDDSDLGNGWFYGEAISGNATVTSRYSPCVVEKLQNGPLVTTFRITKKLKVPVCADYDTFRRSEEYTGLSIVSEITLKADSGKIYIETEIENTAKDHRLRLMLPTHIHGEHYTASSAFYFEQQPVGRNEESISWMEQEHVERQFGGILYKKDAEGCGLAFSAAQGFHQAGVFADEEDTISVVMFRAVGRSSTFTDSERAQLQEKLRFQYVILPLNSSMSDAEIYQRQKFDFYEEIAGCKPAGNCTDVEKSATLQEQRGYCQVPCGMAAAGMEVSGTNVAVSIVKPAEYKENALILRVFNTGDKQTIAYIKLGKKVMRILRTTMDETQKENQKETQNEMLSIASDEARLLLRPYEIGTLCIELDPKEAPCER